jgi:t-SNARE complex subunit (syntaxin)
VGDAHARTEKGVEQLQQAAGYQRKYRKWLLFLVLIVLMIAAGITAYFLIQMKKQ